MICTRCLQDRRRSFFTSDGVCEPCVGPIPPPAPTPGDGPVFTLGQVIDAAARYCLTREWLPEAEARDKGMKSSAQQLLEYLIFEPMTECTAAPVPVFAWLRSIESRAEEHCSDYECAAVLLARTGIVTPDTFPLAASLYHAWRKQADRPSPPPPPEPEGIHYGTVGTRVNIPGCQCVDHKALGVNEEHPEWGERFLIRFIAASGEALTWFASAGGKFDPKPGETYNVRASIVKHDVYNNRRSTIINRCEEFDPATGKPLHPRGRKKEPE